MLDLQNATLNLLLELILLLQTQAALPAVPSNARYLFHQNECYDWGTFGWALKAMDINATSYKYFVLMNSSVRGPFVPTYIKVRANNASSPQKYLLVLATITEALGGVKLLALL